MSKKNKDSLHPISEKNIAIRGGLYRYARDTRKVPEQEVFNPWSEGLC